MRYTSIIRCVISTEALSQFIIERAALTHVQNDSREVALHQHSEDALLISSL